MYQCSKCKKQLSKGEEYTFYNSSGATYCYDCIRTLGFYHEDKLSSVSTEDQLIMLAESHMDDIVANQAMAELRQRFDITYIWCIDCDGLVCKSADCCLKTKKRYKAILPLILIKIIMKRRDVIAVILISVILTSLTSRLLNPISTSPQKWWVLPVAMGLDVMIIITTVLLIYFDHKEKIQ